MKCNRCRMPFATGEVAHLVRPLPGDSASMDRVVRVEILVCSTCKQFHEKGYLLADAGVDFTGLPHLMQTEQKVLLLVAGGDVWMSEAGKVYRWDPEKRTSREVTKTGQALLDRGICFLEPGTRHLNGVGTLRPTAVGERLVVLLERQSKPAGKRELAAVEVPMAREVDVLRFLVACHNGRAKRSTSGYDLVGIDRAGASQTRCEKLVAAARGRGWLSLRPDGLYRPTSAGYEAVLEKLKVKLLEGSK